MNLLPCLFNGPALLHRPFAEKLLVEMGGVSADYGDTVSYKPRPYGFIDGVAIIPVRGVLTLERCWYMDSTSYQFIRLGFSTALADPDVKAIMFDVESPGGEVSGCFDLVDAIYAGRGVKPIWSILSESAYSAAYAIASASDRIIVPRTGGTGSVGVICMAMEYSKMLEQFGIGVTLFTYGARKGDGNEFQPLAKEAAARFQADVDTMGELFVETVARNRKLSADKVRDTEATTFLGAAGVEVGFADAVMAPDEAFQSLLDELGE